MAMRQNTSLMQGGHLGSLGVGGVVSPLQRVKRALLELLFNKSNNTESPARQSPASSPTLESLLSTRPLSQLLSCFLVVANFQVQDFPRTMVRF